MDFLATLRLVNVRSHLDNRLLVRTFRTTACALLLALSACEQILGIEEASLQDGPETFITTDPGEFSNDEEPIFEFTSS